MSEESKSIDEYISNAQRWTKQLDKLVTEDEISNEIKNVSNALDYAEKSGTVGTCRGALYVAKKHAETISQLLQDAEDQPSPEQVEMYIISPINSALERL